MPKQETWEPFLTLSPPVQHAVLSGPFHQCSEIVHHKVGVRLNPSLLQGGALVSSTQLVHPIFLLQRLAHRWTSNASQANQVHVDSVPKPHGSHQRAGLISDETGHVASEFLGSHKRGPLDGRGSIEEVKWRSEEGKISSGQEP